MPSRIILPDEHGEHWLVVPPALFSLRTSLSKAEVEDRQIRSALAAYPCRARDEVLVEPIDDQDEADRRVRFRELCVDIELTALTSPTTKRYLHLLAAVGQHLEAIVATDPQLSQLLLNHSVLLADDPMEPLPLRLKVPQTARLISLELTKLLPTKVVGETTGPIDFGGLRVRARRDRLGPPRVQLYTPQNHVSLSSAQEALAKVIVEKDRKSRTYVLVVLNAPLQDDVGVPIDGPAFELLEAGGTGPPVPTRHVRAAWVHLYGTDGLLRVPLLRR